MSNLLKSKFLLGVMTVAIMFVGAVAVATTASADCTVTPTVKVGSTGVNVQCVQTIVGATADGSFGPLTKAAVMAWQSGHNLTADGVVGPMTATAMNSGSTSANLPAGCQTGDLFSGTTGLSCSGGSSNLPAGCQTGDLFSGTTGLSCSGGSTPSTPSNTGPLVGTDGTISDINQLSSFNNEEVGDGANDVKVMGFDLVTSNDGDVAVKSIKLTFDGADSSGSTRVADYLDSVKILMGSTEVGVADMSDFNKDSTGVYSKTITLSGAVLRADTTTKFYVAVDAVSNLDSGDIATTADNWEVGINNIRYEDGSGVVTTESDLMPAAIEYNSTGDGVNISFVSYSTSADTELKISLNSTPVAQVVKVSATADSVSPLVILKGKLKLEGTSDVLLDSFPILFTTTESDLVEVTPTVYLTLGTEEFSESVTGGASTETVAFDNLDYTIDAGSTVNFTVSVDLNDIQSSTFDEGTTLKAELTTTLRDGASFVAENAQGDALVDATEKTGSALGEVQTFRSTGINVVLVGTTADVAKGLTTAPDVGTYTITFDVTAFGADMYIDGTKPTLTGEDSTTLTINDPGTSTQTAVITSPTGATMTGTVDTTSRFLVTEGETERFTITSIVTPTVTGGLTAVSLTSLAYDDADIDLVDATNIEYTTNLTQFITSYKNLVLTN
ncbi:MAG: peptidoglycan-binding domain-containing protein [Candidatus Paceibacterota bacterium]|jgi:hypothetical protein